MNHNNIVAIIWERFIISNQLEAFEVMKTAITHTLLYCCSVCVVAVVN